MVENSMLSPFDPHATVADFTYADGKGFVVRVPIC